MTDVVVQFKNELEKAATTVRAIRKADDVSAAVNAILGSGWNFVDPERREWRFVRPPAEVEVYLRSLIEGFPPTWQELSRTPSRLGLLQRIIEAWFRWVNSRGAR